MSVFYFWLAPRGVQLSYRKNLDCIEIDNLRYKANFLFEKTSISKLFQLCNFSIKIHNLQQSSSKKLSSTISISRNYEVEIECYVMPISFLNLENELSQLKIQYARLTINNSFNLEAFSRMLLRKINSKRTFTDQVDLVQIGSSLSLGSKANL
jgi:hypothetical protein